MAKRDIVDHVVEERYPAVNVEEWQRASDELIDFADSILGPRPECNYCGNPICPHCSHIDFGIKPL